MIDFGQCSTVLGPCLSWGTLVAAAAVSLPQFVGLFLFNEGIADLQRGCEEQCNEHNWINHRLQRLKIVLPSMAVIRIFCAPSMWFFMADEFHGPDWPVLGIFPMIWFVNMLVSWGLFFQVIMMPGMANILNSLKTISYWPLECHVERPYHGLASTRCHALSGGFWSEFLWNVWIVLFYGDTSIGMRIAGITIPLIVFNTGMILGGPVNFLSRNPYKDRWVAQTYIAVGIVAVEGYLLLNFAWFGIRQAVDPVTNLSRLGPYGHWSVIAWNVIIIAQALICRTSILGAEELKPGAPWAAGGADHKEFFFPRFWGQIYFCYGIFVSFNLWILGNWVWAEEAVVRRGWLG